MAHVATRRRRHARGMVAIVAVIAVGILGLTPANAAIPVAAGAPATARVAAATTTTIVRSTPSIGGTLAVGSTLKAYVGTVSPSDARVSYQWYAGGVKLSGATSKYLPLTSAQAGKAIVVRVQLSKPGYTTSVAWGKRDGVVTVPSIVRNAPTIGGTLRSGSKLTAYVGAFSPSTAKVSYQWYVGGAKRDGATGKYLILKDSDIGHKVSVKVTLSSSGYVDSSAWATGSTGVGWQRASMGADGMYRVGADVQPGIYYAPFADACYWERSSGASGSFDEIIANAFGYGQRMAEIVAGDAYFVSDGCGPWFRYDGTTYAPADDHWIAGDEVVAVGIGAHVLPGLYRSENNSSCYWALLDAVTGDFRAIVANHLGDGDIEVRLGNDDKFFESSGCNDWVSVG